MKEKELEVLKQYDIDVKSIRKIRGAILCDTVQGAFVLKEMPFSEKRIPALFDLYQCIQEQGYKNVDAIIKNKEDEYLTTSEEGTKYLLKKWFYGRECDSKKEPDILEGVQNLALLHRIMKRPNMEQKPQEDLYDEFLRHNREMKKVRTFIRDRVNKGDFEIVFLKHFEEMYEWAEAATLSLSDERYKTLLEHSEKEGTIVHGDYNYHNILITNSGIATTNFDRFRQGIQLSDFYYFLRKTMEKNQWDINLGNKMLECYNRILPFSEEELEYIAVSIAYPEKFWKVANSYYRSRKAWISEKNLEKLKTAIRQTEGKKKFLQELFSFF